MMKFEGFCLAPFYYYPIVSFPITSINKNPPGFKLTKTFSRTFKSSFLSSKYPKEVNIFNTRSYDSGRIKLRISSKTHSTDNPSDFAFSFAFHRRNRDLSTPVTEKPFLASKLENLPGPQQRSNTDEPLKSTNFKTFSTCSLVSSNNLSGNKKLYVSFQNDSFSNHSVIINTYSL